jgi:hypothetical protein
MKIKGLDKLQKTLKEVARAAEQTDDEIGSVHFDPNDPASIEQAIATMESMVDAKFGGTISNPLIQQIADGLKEQARSAILDRAAAERLKGST